MPICFAGALSHAPGITAWPDAAAPDQSARLQAGFAALRQRLEAARLDALIVFTSEHWANFFLDHIGAFCVGRAEHFTGPVEPWLKVASTRIAGEPALAQAILAHCYAGGVEPSFAHEMRFDHGTMVPLHFLTPRMDLPVVPIMINALAAPQPSAARCHALGRLVGEVAAASKLRIGLVATGGLSHDPGELRHGEIDSDFDHRFMAQMGGADIAALTGYSTADLGAAGAGAIELLAWVALAGAMGRFHGEVLAYEAVVPWATGIGVMGFELAA
jgi:aromatic ring-opening dioxygenase catalytic subunit (LigB family)